MNIPTEDISLDELFALRGPATYLVRVEGDSMIGAGIHDDDILIVDKSITPKAGQIVIAAVNGEPLVKRLAEGYEGPILLSENPRYPKRYILDEDDFMIWGVVRFSVRSHLA